MLLFREKLRISKYQRKYRMVEQKSYFQIGEDNVKMRITNSHETVKKSVTI